MRLKILYAVKIVTLPKLFIALNSNQNNSTKRVSIICPTKKKKKKKNLIVKVHPFFFKQRETVVLKMEDL